jgi:hypothetical protein
VVFTIVGLDVVSIVAMFDMYKELKYLSNDMRTDVPLGLYSSVCFYLIPNDGFVKLTKRFPLTCLFDRKIKNMLKDKTYNGRDILEILETIKNVKWEDIKDKAIFISIK